MGRMVDQELLGLDEQADELLLMGLRLREGVDLAAGPHFPVAIWIRTARPFLLEHGFVERL